jgi:hypothetical protein
MSAIAPRQQQHKKIKSATTRTTIKMVLLCRDMPSLLLAQTRYARAAAVGSGG